MKFIAQNANWKAEITRSPSQKHKLVFSGRATRKSDIWKGIPSLVVGHFWEKVLRGSTPMGKLRWT